MKRRSLLKYGGLGLGGLVAAGVVYEHRSGWPTIVTDDDETSVQPPGQDTPQEPTRDEGIEIDLQRETDGVNSDSVTFVHDAFVVCNHGSDDASIWIDADPIENTRGEDSVRFYRGRALGDRIDDPGRAVDLPPKECLHVGVMTRTFGLSSEKPLLEKAVVRSDREE